MSEIAEALSDEALSKERGKPLQIQWILEHDLPPD
jgi:hypothetical protein